jgi:signal peptidase II
LKRSYLAIGLILLVLLIDQTVKIWVKLHMKIGDSFNFFGKGHDWFQIYFTENPGMAFGLELGGDYGKLALSLFRIVAVGFITYYLYILCKQKKSLGLVASIALIWAGAVGNILDSIFYGLIFSGSLHQVATVTAFGEGYASFLHGKVVDMLHFPLIEGHYPRWFPFVGGQGFKFFEPIFNIADTSISVGVGMVIVFYRRFFSEPKLSPPSSDLKTEATDETTSEILTDGIKAETDVTNENPLGDNKINLLSLKVDVNLTVENGYKTDDVKPDDKKNDMVETVNPEDSNQNNDGADIPNDHKPI